MLFCDSLDLPQLPYSRNSAGAAHSYVYLGSVQFSSVSRVWLFATPWTAAHQAPPSMGFSRQEYWSGVPLPSLLLSGRRTQTSDIFFSLLYTNLKRRFLLKYCVAIMTPGST